MDSFINFCIEFIIAFILVDACIKIGRGVVDIYRLAKMVIQTRNDAVHGANQERARKYHNDKVVG